MTQPFTVLHGRHGRAFGDILPGSLVWTTCLREVAFVDRLACSPDCLDSADAMYSGAEAYRFLLEIVCGLHSPLVGETQVMGQFREFVARVPATDDRWRDVRSTCHRVLTEARGVRARHLNGLGARTYGSVVSRFVRGAEHLAVAGSGQLSRAILPSLDPCRVDVFTRDPGRHADLVSRHPGVTLRPFEKLAETVAVAGGDVALIVAAPVAAEQVHSWLNRAGRKISRILDLRAEGARDAIVADGAEVIPFRAVLESLEANKRFEVQQVQSARKEIEHLSVEYGRRCDVRPFGWEDLCA